MNDSQMHFLMCTSILHCIQWDAHVEAHQYAGAYLGVGQVSSQQGHRPGVVVVQKLCLSRAQGIGVPIELLAKAAREPRCASVNMCIPDYFLPQLVNCLAPSPHTFTNTFVHFLKVVWGKPVLKVGGNISWAMKMFLKHRPPPMWHKHR